MKDKLLLWLWRHSKKIVLYFFWLLLTLILGIYFFNHLTGEDRTLFIPGKTSHGHYQIEIDCDSCHQKKSHIMKKDACIGCHKEKKFADTKRNSHRAKIFEADDKADQREKIRADICISCHQEHKLGRNELGVNQPIDFCILCHEDVADDRPSHKDLPFDKCGDCHNYHDNAASYMESFIEKHLDEEANTIDNSSLPTRNFAKRYKNKHSTKPLAWHEKDAPKIANIKLALDWENSSHALMGVNCNDCHHNKDKQWVNKPDHKFCRSCHKNEVKTFLLGKHGMRLKQSLSAMTTINARLPMKNNHQQLGCNSCHLGHRFNTNYAEVEACLQCHDDNHSQTYKNSKHYQLWKNQDSQGVSCANCHLPKLKKGKKIQVQHNQNDNLRPNQKMIKAVCVNCHGLEFSFDALHDETLIDNNFSTSPTKHIPLLEMWRKNFNKKTPKESSHENTIPVITQ